MSTLQIFAGVIFLAAITFLPNYSHSDDNLPTTQKSRDSFATCKMTSKKGMAFWNCSALLEAEIEKERFGRFPRIKVSLFFVCTLLLLHKPSCQFFNYLTLWHLFLFVFQKCCSFIAYRECVVETAAEHCLDRQDRAGLIHYLTHHMEIQMGMKISTDTTMVFDEFCEEYLDSKTPILDCLQPKVLYSGVFALITASFLIMLVFYIVYKIARKKMLEETVEDQQALHPKNQPISLTNSVKSVSKM